MRGKKRQFIAVFLGLAVVWSFFNLYKRDEFTVKEVGVNRFGESDHGTSSHASNDDIESSSSPPSINPLPPYQSNNLNSPAQVSHFNTMQPADIPLNISTIIPIQPLPPIDKQLHNQFNLIRDQLMELENSTIQDKFFIPKSQSKNGKFQPNGEEIILLSACDGPKTGVDALIMAMAIENRNEYTKKHNYIHHFIDTTKFKVNGNRQNHPVWLKISAIRETLEKYPQAKWVWWLDIDAIVMNPNIDLAEHLLHPHILEQRLTYDRPLNNINDVNDIFTGLTYKSKGQVDISKIDFIFSQDYSGINAGSFFIRRSEFSFLLLDIWDSIPLINFNFKRLEQDAFIYLFTKFKSVYDHTGLVSQRIMNSYHNLNPRGYDKYWPGDFVIHFAGKSKSVDYKDLWDRYWEVRNSTSMPYGM